MKVPNNGSTPIPANMCGGKYPRFVPLVILILQEELLLTIERSDWESMFQETSLKGLQCREAKFEI